MRKYNYTKIIETKVLNAIVEYDLIEPYDIVLIGLSGGADSVFLLNILNKFKSELRISLALIYVNHQLRDGEADRDEAFCENICGNIGVNFLIEKISVKEYAKTHKLSLEMAGRKLRYEAYQKTALRIGATKIATGHHLNDLVETTLMRLFKGTGASGLGSIPVKRGNIIRPILYIKKDEIELYLKENDMEYITDSSNFDNKFERNYIRNEIIPLIEKRFPAFRDKIMDLSKIICDEEDFWTKSVNKLEKYISFDKNRIDIKKSLFLDNPSPAIIRRFLRQTVKKYIETDFVINLKLTDEIIKFSKNANGNKIIFLDNNIRIVSSYDIICMEKLDKNFDNSIKYVKLLEDSRVYYGGISLEIRRSRELKKEEIIKNKNNCYFDNKGLNGIIFRRRKKGDRIKIANVKNNVIIAKKTKKVKNIFIDSKFDLQQRKNSIMIESDGGKLIAFFVPNFGFRVSADFYVENEPCFVIQASHTTDK